MVEWQAHFMFLIPSKIIIYFVALPIKTTSYKIAHNMQSVFLTLVPH